ncbi:MAG: serine hydrolase [Bacteroidales bacterium]|jgi:CubicO group peptidase (beta-lactamase class C family)|nr:serine hydrolase [Bacteroidales bacterium]
MNLFYKNTIGLIIVLMVCIQFSLSAQDTLNLDQIEKSADKYLTFFSDNNPGAVVTVIKKGDIIFNKAYGMANVTDKVPMNIEKSFNLGELSKSFTALAVLKLVEKNKLNLEDNLSKLFPDFPEYGKKITVKNILDHTSGLANYNIQNLHSNDEVYSFLIKQTGAIFEPASKMKFSNSDYAMLVKVIEKSSGMSYQDFLGKYIFKKLSMNSTFFANEIANKNIAESHFKENEEYIIKKDVSYIYGNQGIYTNSIDFAKWDRALYSTKLLKCDGLYKVFKIGKLTEGENKSDYAYGWVLMAKNGIRYFWHGGMQNGYSNLILHLPDTQMTVLIFTNRNDGYDFLKMAIYIAKLFDKDLKL